MKRYINSDLAVERKGIFDKNHIDASEYSEEEKEYCTVCRLNIMGKENCQKYGKKEGRYVTVFFENLSLINKKSFEDIAISIADEIKHILAFACEKDIRDSSVLVVGLGNSNLSVDAIGPLTLEKLMVTRHIGYEFKKECSVSAITPGVISRTGIETVELVSATVEKIKPDVIVAVDALAAGSCERLGTTVQISDAGITPGSGVGNGRKAIDKESIGIPVISIGVPTVVSSSTLIIDALEKAGVCELSNELIEVLRDGKSFFVSPRECDVIVESASNLIAMSLNIAFGIYS